MPSFKRPPGEEDPGPGWFDAHSETLDAAAGLLGIDTALVTTPVLGGLLLAALVGVLLIVRRLIRARARALRARLDRDGRPPFS